MQLQAQAKYIWRMSDDQFPVTLIEVGDEPARDFNTAKEIPDLLDNPYVGWDQQAQLIWPEHGLQAKINASANLQYCHLFDGREHGSDFFCFEPVSHLPDVHNRDYGEYTGLTAMAPGETLDCDRRITPQSY